MCLDPTRKDSLLSVNMIHHILVYCGMPLRSYQKQLPGLLLHTVNLYIVYQRQIRSVSVQKNS